MLKVTIATKTSEYMYDTDETIDEMFIKISNWSKVGASWHINPKNENVFIPWNKIEDIFVTEIENDETT